MTIPQKGICPYCDEGNVRDFDEEGCLTLKKCGKCNGTGKLFLFKTKG